MKTIAIHQPNYFPWLGYFYKASACDVFVILDDVDFQHGNTSSLTNRTRLKGPNGPFWMTVPVKRKNISSRISDIQIDNTQNWQKKHLKSLSVCYGRCPFYSHYYEMADSLLKGDFISLSDLNTAIIIQICNILDIKTEIVLSGDLDLPPAAKDEKIVAICRHLGGSHYLSGTGAKKYNRPGLFEEAGIELLYTHFTQPEYPQQYGPFVPGLSVLDALFNTGSDVKKVFSLKP